MEEYRKFLAIWECIRQMNNKGIYLYGYATSTDGIIKLNFRATMRKIAIKQFSESNPTPNGGGKTPKKNKKDGRKK